jgi:hypothetical protein
VTGDFSNNFECPFFFFGVDLLESSLLIFPASFSLLGEQREGDKPTAIMKKQQQMTQYLNEKLAGNINSEE